jgi:hypothetical protein
MENKTKPKLKIETKMNNIHTLDSLNNNSNSNTIILTQDSINEASQLLPVLKLRASNNEINEIQNSLDRLVDEHLKYYEENGRNCHRQSSLSESFPSIYPAAIEDGIPVTRPYKFRYCASHRLRKQGRKNTILRVRRVNIAVILAITAPLATVLLVKFGKVSIFDSLGLKLVPPKAGVLPAFGWLRQDIVLPLGRQAHTGCFRNLCALAEGKSPVGVHQAPALFTTLHTRGRIAPRPDSNEQKKKNHLNPKFIKFILFLLLIIICVGLYKYNIFMYIIHYIMPCATRGGEALFFLIYLWFLILIFSIVYNSVGFFILINKNEIDIDLSKLRNKFIRNTIESFICIRNSNIDKEKMEKYFISHLYLSLFLLILSGILIFF